MEVVKNVESIAVERRTSERTRGRRVDYAEKMIVDLSPPRERKQKRLRQEKKAESAPATPPSEDNKIDMVEEAPAWSEEDNVMYLGVDDADNVAHLRVRETLRTFNEYYLVSIQEEEKRCKKEGKKARSKTGGEDEKAKQKRPDLKAFRKMKDEGKVLYRKKRWGAIPGVVVGQEFFSRCEMAALGFHHQTLKGIDYMSKAYCQGENINYVFPICIAVVLSGQYEDDRDDLQEFDYTGEGGNDLLGDKKQIADQEMVRGNLALKNSLAQRIPIRVIRKHSSKKSCVGKVYTYDGLYRVVRCWRESGKAGFKVFKFRLKRLEGQSALTSTQVLFIKGGGVPYSEDKVRGLVCSDISGGQENIPIHATNVVDDPPVALTGFTYIKSLQVSDSVNIPAHTLGCKCKGSCDDPEKCACAKLNGLDFPYVERNGGRLMKANDVVYECGPNCKCGPDCVNRTSQKGLRYRFEVFRTPNKGWGVKSWDYIPSGAPICEYIGVLKRSEEVNKAVDNMYLFDIDCLQTKKGLDGREKRLKDVSIPSPCGRKVGENVEYCIDAGTTGNLARFINHSCEPNLFVQCVLSSHHDPNLARLMLFAAENIPPFQELTYDYAYGSVTGTDGEKQMACYCGAMKCKKWLL